MEVLLVIKLVLIGVAASTPNTNGARKIVSDELMGM
jgi:hypothetical protein